MQIVTSILSLPATSTMALSSTLVNVSDDAEVRLVALLVEAAPANLLSPSFAADCQTSLDAGQAEPLLDTILSDVGAMTALLTLEPPSDAVSTVALLTALMDRAGRSIQTLVKALLPVPGQDARKLTLLSILYNMRADAQEKTQLLQQLFQLAGSTAPQLLEDDQALGALLTAANSSAPKIVTLLDAWNVTDRQELYRTIASVTSGATKQKFLLLLLETYPNESTNTAKEAAIGAILDPVTLFIQQRSMLTMPAIQALQKEHSTLYGLLQIIQEGKLSDYQAFLQKHGGPDKVLRPYSLDADACLRNMRILSLCSLASEHEEVPYSTIAETLQLPSDEQVESWVIVAVSTGLLQAKMDQLRHMVMIEHCVVRKFDMEQWKVLQRRLQHWKQNVGSVLQGLKEAQQQ